MHRRAPLSPLIYQLTSVLFIITAGQVNDVHANQISMSKRIATNE